MGKLINDFLSTPIPPAITQSHMWHNVAHNLFADELPLVRVKAGPMCENVDQIQALLKQYGYDGPVERSTISIRTAASIQLTRRRS
jgi:hypothetical protein